MRLAPGGGRYALVTAILAALGLLVSGWVTLGLGIVTAFVVWFFRDPDRTPPETGVVSPADGRVSVIRTEGERLRIGVFMSPFDVHVNRAPVTGEVTALEHTPGAHKPAFSKDSDRNERVHIRLATEGPNGASVETDVVLIAGAFARRITPYLAVGDRVTRGDRIGHIAFGSRADVIFPPTVDRADILVTEGETVRAGETVLATP